MLRYIEHDRNVKLPTGIVVYTMVLRAYGQADKIKLPKETFLEMLDVGCEPDDITCGTMLCAYARWGHLKPMLSFYSAVQDRGVTLPLSVYNLMMPSLQTKGLHQDVRQIWQDMCSIKGVPNHFTFTVVVCSLVKEGILDEAMKAFNQMKGFGFVPEGATYSLLITASVKAGKQDDAMTLYQEMRSRRLVPSNFTCALLLTLYYRNGDYSKALSLFLEMENYKIVADEVIYGLIIKIYGRLGLYEDAVKTYEETKRMGLLTKEKNLPRNGTSSFQIWRLP
ncbi:Pentatricopeptide repeat-containing protein [Drosera capensis]